MALNSSKCQLYLSLTCGRNRSSEPQNTLANQLLSSSTWMCSLGILHRASHNRALGCPPGYDPPPECDPPSSINRHLAQNLWVLRTPLFIHTLCPTPFQLCLQNISRIQLLHSPSTAANMVQTSLLSPGLSALAGLLHFQPFRAHSGYTLSPRPLCMCVPLSGMLFSSHLGPCSNITFSWEAFPDHFCNCSPYCYLITPVPFPCLTSL